MAWAIALGTPSTSGLDGITGALEPKTIDEQFMTAAIRLWSDFFWPNARAVLRQIGLSDRHKNARLALRCVCVCVCVCAVSALSAPPSRNSFASHMVKAAHVLTGSGRHRMAANHGRAF
jgi:hypothetical protein